MARGFWKGLVHGGLLSGAVLAVLSLVAPLSDSPLQPAAPEKQAAVEPVPEPVPVEPVPEVAEPATVAEETAPSEPAPAPAANAGPNAAAVDLPVGSEFGRGDVAPVLPAPLTVPEGRSVSEAPAVSAPAAEPSPVTVTASDPRPEAQMGDDDINRAEPDKGEAAPALVLPSMQPAPMTAALPDMGAAGRADLSPLLPEMAQEQVAPPLPVQDEEPAVVVDTPVQEEPAVVAETPVQTPREANAPDLSLPPSLSDLGATTRE